LTSALTVVHSSGASVVDVSKAGTGVTLTSGLTGAHTASEPVIAPGTGITIDAPLASAHAAGVSARPLGTGITFAPALTAGHALGSAVSSLGTGIGVEALTKAHNSGATVVGPAPADVCRPAGSSPNAGSCKPIRPGMMLRKSFSVAPVS